MWKGREENGSHIELMPLSIGTYPEIFLKVIERNSDVLAAFLQLYTGVSWQDEVESKVLYRAAVHGEVLYGQPPRLCRLQTHIWGF